VEIDKSHPCPDMGFSEGFMARESLGAKMSEEFDPKILVEHIDSFGHNLSEWEKDFIANMLDNPPQEYSEKQIKVINRIYDEKC